MKKTGYFAIKLLAAALLSLMLALPVNAAKQDWYDKNFKFAGKHTIFASLIVPDAVKNGVSELEITDFFYKALYNKMTKPLAKYGSQIKIASDIVKDAQALYGVDLNALFREAPGDAARKFAEVSKETCDLWFYAKILNYGTGKEYAEGYYINTPATQRSNVVTSGGQIATVTTQTTQQTYIPGGNFPVIYVIVEFGVIDNKTGQVVWKRIDDRSRMNRRLIDNTRPRDVINRIFPDFMGDYLKRVEEQSGKN